jgi:CheY-like chemotaxis protein
MAKILVTDDSKFQRNTIGKHLIALGHSVTYAGDGLECLKCLETERPDCIITDLLMPNMTGDELLKNLLDAGNTIPIIVISANIQAPMRSLCLELGAKAFLSKPFNTDELSAALGRLIVAQRSAS